MSASASASWTGAALRPRSRFAGREIEIVPVALQQRFQGPQVERKPVENLVLFQLVRHRYLDRAIERQVTLVNTPQDLDCQLHDVVAGEHIAAKLGPRLFDLPGERHFFAP